MGGKLTFAGGIHPYDGKELSKDKPIKDILPKGDLVYPLSQHIGAPARAIVKKGDAVLTGQMIAEAGGFVSAPIYATVSGRVKAIEPRRVVTGDMVMSIIIENDGQYREVEYEPPRPLEQLSKEEIIDICHQLSKSILLIGSREESFIHIMGEMTLTFALVTELKDLGYTCLASTTERKVEINENGDKVVHFEFVQFREY